ncbi:unnamed protein product [Echinostoma caproni]|uniref:SAM domain-containing protein n=1 Tax=Echinostoma caproni TaxID=27848 RepID=A0A183A5U0_9TREM|nr:unnamed protein product [Echinostoma caproni]
MSELIAAPTFYGFLVAAWLDDLGLTAYTAAFDAAAVDLLVLNHLTIDDLITLKMTSELHFLSLRRGLQMLRRMKYDISHICRGPGSVEEVIWSSVNGGKQEHDTQKETNTKCDALNVDTAKETHSNSSLVVEAAGDTSNTPARSNSRSSLVRSKRFPLHVCYWSQYRVMAWLHQIELPEYAPELCGSGVHGALMVLEDRFTPDLLASILHIPSTKTLVRRHLANKFMELVGEHIWDRKQALSITAKGHFPVGVTNIKVDSELHYIKLLRLLPPDHLEIHQINNIVGKPQPWILLSLRYSSVLEIY